VSDLTERLAALGIESAAARELTLLAWIAELEADVQSWVSRWETAVKALKKAEAERDAAASELRSVDDRLSRRPALADISDRLAKIERACFIAARAEYAEAELAEVEAELEAEQSFIEFCLVERMYPTKRAREIWTKRGDT